MLEVQVNEMQAGKSQMQSQYLNLLEEAEHICDILCLNQKIPFLHKGITPRTRWHLMLWTQMLGFTTLPIAPKPKFHLVSTYQGFPL